MRWSSTSWPACSSLGLGLRGVQLGLLLGQHRGPVCLQRGSGGLRRLLERAAAASASPACCCSFSWSAWARAWAARVAADGCCSPPAGPSDRGTTGTAKGGRLGGRGRDARGVGAQDEGDDRQPGDEQQTGPLASRPSSAHTHGEHYGRAAGLEESRSVRSRHSWLDVHGDGVQLGKGLLHRRAGGCGDVVALGDAQVGIDREDGVRAQPVSDPAHLDLLDGEDPGNVGEHGLRPGDEARVDAVEQATADVADGAVEDDEDRDGDEEPDERVGDRVSQGDSDGADDDTERGDAVGLGVPPVRDERCGTDPGADADPVDGDDLVPRQPTTPAATTTQRYPTGTGSWILRMLSHAATTADAAIMSTTTRPARSSTRPSPYVKRRDGGRRASVKATHSGTAVSASERLCTVSASSATEPERTTTAAWTSAVTPSTARLTRTARLPSSLASSAWSVDWDGSWLCGRITWRSRATSPRVVRVLVVVLVVVLVAVLVVVLVAAVGGVAVLGCRSLGVDLGVHTGHGFSDGTAGRGCAPVAEALTTGSLHLLVEAPGRGHHPGSRFRGRGTIPTSNRRRPCAG